MYHTSSECEPSQMFHGRVSYIIFDHKLGLKFITGLVPATDIAEELMRRTQVLYDKTEKNAMQSYIRYKKYYDKKAKAWPVQEKDYCYILQPEADHQGSKIPFREFRRIGPYVVQKYYSTKVTKYAKQTPTKLFFNIASDFANSLLKRSRKKITTTKNSDVTMLLLCLRMLVQHSMGSRF